MDRDEHAEWPEPASNVGSSLWPMIRDSRLAGHAREVPLQVGAASRIFVVGGGGGQCGGEGC